MSKARTSRPYPAPEGRPWLISMAWKGLLFAHWPLEPSKIRELIPESLELDLWEGKAWIGVVPFEMIGTRPRICPAIPPISNFPELNVRTYVIKDGKPGVWFFSLDAGSKLAVRLARLTYNLPYFDASFQIMRSGQTTRYIAERTHKFSLPAELDVKYKPLGKVEIAEPGSFEYWLTARYCLYSANAKERVFRGEIDHEPWPLQKAEAEFKVCNMTGLLDLELEGEPTSLLYSDYLDVKAWPIIKT